MTPFAYLNMQKPSHVSKACLEAKRRQHLAGETDEAREHLATLTSEYEDYVMFVMDSPRNCMRPLFFWLPYCEYRLAPFEARVAEDGYVCAFAKDVRDISYGATGYIVAETEDGLESEGFEVLRSQKSP